MADTEVLVGELLKEEDNKLVLVAKESGLAEQKQHMLLASFGEYFTSAVAVIGQSQDLEVTSEDQKDDIEQAGIARKELKRLRCDAENQRKSLKEASLREGQAVDKMFNVIKEIIKPEEDRLEEIEKIVERAAEKRRQAKIAERRAMLAGYVENTTVYKYEDISDEDFVALIKELDDARNAREEEAKRRAAEEEAARKKAEEERVAREKAMAVEQERIRKENEKLKADAEAKAELERKRVSERSEQLKEIGIPVGEVVFGFRVSALDLAGAEDKEWEGILAEAKRRVQMDEDKKAADIKAEAERQAELAKERKAADAEREMRKSLEAEIMAKAHAEAKAQAEAEEQQRQSLLAPDKDKLTKFADELDAIALPNVSNREAGKLLDETKDFLTRISKNLRVKAEQL